MSETRQMILGVDFDDTLFLNSFPHNYTNPNWKVIRHVIQRMNEGWYIILVTCRTAPELVSGGVEAARKVGVTFDAINQNHPAQVAKWGECRKIYCDEYIDDKNWQPTTDCDRKPIIFISGRMRGLPDNGKHSFDAAEAILRDRGYIVLNPSDLPAGMPEDRYMPICTAMLQAADAIYMLDGWQESKGANAEFRYAVCQGKQIIYEKTVSPERTCNGFEKNSKS